MQIWMLASYKADRTGALILSVQTALGHYTSQAIQQTSVNIMTKPAYKVGEYTRPVISSLFIILCL